MDHFSTLALLIETHRKKYNELKRLYRQLNKSERGSEWRRQLVGYNVWCTSLENSHPKFVVPGLGQRAPVESVLNSKHDIAQYRKWCRLAASWRQAKWDAHELLCGIRAVGKAYGTKVQTRSNDGNSFNRPFFIEIDGVKKPIKKFMDDQAFEDIILRGDKS